MRFFDPFLMRSAATITAGAKSRPRKAIFPHEKKAAFSRACTSPSPASTLRANEP